MQPLVFDLFCGLGGWTEAFLAQGWRAVGFDIEAHDYGNGGYPGELVLRDVRSLNGADLVKEFGSPDCIVASPPCQEFSYMAMPWSKAKEKMRKILADEKEQVRLTELFNHCFRIQREVSAAAGRYVPIVIENVRGAQRWVGKARWNFGSFYLWGDVPALMPIPAKAKLKTLGPATAAQVENHSCHINEMRDSLKDAGLKAGDRNVGKNGEHKWNHSFADALKGEGNKTAGLNWSDRTIRGQDFTRVAGKQAMEETKLPGNNSARRRDEREVKRLCDANEGRKNFTPNGEPLGKNTLGRRYGSKSKKRKQASAEIAKIPPALSHWIARCFTPKSSTERSAVLK